MPYDPSNPYGGNTGFAGGYPGPQAQLDPRYGRPAPPPPSGPSTGAEAAKLGGNVINTISKGRTGSSLGGNLMGKIPGLSGGAGQIIGKVLPFAGLATGTMGLIHGGSTLHNIGSGFTAGASLGSIVPGLGTLVGGGIGAGVGLVRSMIHGGPSEQEKAGRTAGGDLTSRMAAGASNEQYAEAAKAAQTGPWKGNLQGALSLIALRDQLVKQGLSPENAVSQSNYLMGKINPATRGGTGAVNSAASPIMQIMGYR